MINIDNIILLLAIGVLVGLYVLAGYVSARVIARILRPGFLRMISAIVLFALASAVVGVAEFWTTGLFATGDVGVGSDIGVAILSIIGVIAGFLTMLGTLSGGDRRNQDNTASLN